MLCNNCGFIPKVLPNGIFEITTPSPILLESLNALFNLSGESFLIPYDNLTDLTDICSRIDDHFSSNASKTFSCATLTLRDDKKPAIAFPHFYVRLQNLNYITIMQEGLFTAHMQPILSLERNETVAYEFLLRPTNDHYSFQPFKLFEMAQNSGLQSFLDSAARTKAIEISSKFLPNGIKRFINFLPSSIYDPAHCLKTTFRAVEDYNVNPGDLVFEVVETEQIQRIDHLKKIFTSYKQEGMKVALDDLGTGYATKEILLALKPDYAKIDRQFIDQCYRDRSKQDALREIAKLANEEGIQLLAEGIERKEEADFCNDIGISLGQGYYFGKPSEKPLFHLHT
ncbi:EAL domain-containing protein [Alkalihalobacillus sp. CinArs1]|uniref:EAL domain-containing protein n=1 Tax=Alkalihalobacillus sp. CinArs1 TaxID=2995314 RepID=UPI0022DE882F|nr:EAL domain-containing protein [Alkalihalobacillus sp. CinArs1]